MTRRVVLPLLLLALAGAAQARARPDPWAAPSWQKAAAPDVPPEVLEKRAVLADPQADEGAVSAAATILLGHGDLVALRAALAGAAQVPALGVLSALGVVDPPLSEPLLEDVVALSARTGDDVLRARAEATLDKLLNGRHAGAAARVGRVLGWLRDAGFDPARREVLLAALGRSGQLELVEALIEALAGPGAAGARAALQELTGHDLGAEADAAAWRAFWDEHRHLTRERLLERGLDRARQQVDRAEQQREDDRVAFVAKLGEVEQKVVAERITFMGNALERLLKGLSDEYADVRLEAATRLAAKGNDEKAASTALPALLRRLGRSAANGNGHPGGTGETPGEPPAESDLRVRAALVRALGVLGRPRETQAGDAAPAVPAVEAQQREVRRALVAELTAPDASVAAAAADVLEQFRNQPEVVAPLLDYIARLPADAVDERVGALKAVAANGPLGVSERLQQWAALEQPTAVRAAAVRALIACEDLDVVLESLGQIYGQDPSREVRFGLAAALGDRLGRPAPDDEATRASVVRVLGRLLDDEEPSVRAEVVTALGRSGQATAMDGLARRARQESDETVQDRLVAALGELRQVEGAATIGQLLAARQEHRATLRDAAQAAVALIANGEPARWLACGQALSAEGAHDVAAFCGGEVVRRFSQAPEHQEPVDRARGLQAVELALDGRWAEARPLLAALAAAGAAFPARDELLLHLSEACEHLEDWPGAADWRVQRLAALPPGDARLGPETLLAARALVRAGRALEAQPLLAQHVEAHAEDNLALFELAGVEESLDRLEEARRTLERLDGRLAEGDQLRPRVLEARERIAQRLASRAAPEPPSGTQRTDEAPEPAGPPDAAGPGLATGAAGGP